MSKKSTRVSIIFPYIGNDNDVRKGLMDIIEAVLGKKYDLNTSNKKPVLVVNVDTVSMGMYKEFKKYLKDNRREGLLDGMDVIQVWAVDTCQMWLEGFGKIIDDNKEYENGKTESVLQIPGDLKYVKDFSVFLTQLTLMNADVESEHHDFVVGDFEVEETKSKHLIDMYGTYPLIFNWFPDVAKKLQEMGIKRIRSEFFAARLNFLEEMLHKRKFAYEQTLAFLIHALSDCKDKKKWKIGYVNIGKIADYGERRGFREANDQIERTERLLKFLWREKNGGDSFDVREFEILDRRSTAIREAAIVSLENFLKK